MKGLRLLIMAATLLTALTPQINIARAQGGGGNTVVTQQSAQWVEGNQRITPAKGTAGTTPYQNFRPYNLPGEFIQETPPPGAIITGTYDIAYANKNQPVQTSDWWTGVGLQWPGWVQGVNPTNPVIQTPAIFNEPWNLNFMDLPNDPQYNKVAPGLPIAPQGLRLFNRSAMRIVTYATVPTDTMTAATTMFGYGDNAQQDSPII